MRSLKALRNLADDVPELTDQAKQSLASLDSGVRRANSTMTVLAVVAVVALGLAVVALLRATAVARG